MLARSVLRVLRKGACRSAASGRCTGRFGTAARAQTVGGPGTPSAPVSPTISADSARRVALLGFGVLGLGTAWWGFSQTEKQTEAGEQATFTNWSGTHDVSPKTVYQPETMAELEYLVAQAHKNGTQLRPVGSALSPNGLSFNSEGMLSMALLDKILEIDEEKGQVRVQCGARVQEVVEALRPHGLTLQNYASIREQQIGGFIQVGAHGTGATIPPVDEQVVSMRLVTPADGPVELSNDRNPELFRLVRVGLGAFGVVSEVTLQCVPSHRLLEKTFVTDLATVKKQHSRWLKDNRHLRYMWIPHTDAVVVVQCNPLPAGQKAHRHSANSQEFCLKPFVELCLERKSALGPMGHDEDSIKAMNFAQIRDVLVAMEPLDVEWIKRVNQAEALYWRRSEGYREGWSDEILGFDCGGQQWVLEVALPTGTLKHPSHDDLKYMADLMAGINSSKIPAPAPIEQRWTSTSSSYLSPASSASPDTLHSWVGIIMYLPSDDPIVRTQITSRFQEYASFVEGTMMPKYGAVWHWAKLEVPGNERDRASLREYMAKRYPLEKVATWRKRLDPKGVVGNSIVDAVFPIT